MLGRLEDVVAQRDLHEALGVLAERDGIGPLVEVASICTCLASSPPCP